MAGRLVLVPKGSIRSLDGRDVVFVVQNGRAERRAVTVGLAQDNDLVLNAGVAAGESVIVDSPAGLADGVRVKVVGP
jgi:HlyD family secretion protein